MKSFFKRGLSFLTALAVCGTLGSGVCAEYRDMPDGWSRPALESAVENHILQGFDGMIDPTGFLTRAQLATVIVRVFGAKNAADISRFIDVSERDWFHDYVAGAIHMGIMNGTGFTTMSPLENATREQVFTVLAKALRLDDGDTSLLNKFSDSEKVSDWAAGPVAAMVAAGYVSGSDGMLLPGTFITREQFAQVLYNIFRAYYSEAGTYSQDADGSVIVNSPDVVLENMSVKGDVIIGDGVGEGDVWLNNVEIGGRLLVRGGGVNSIHLNATDVGKITIAKVDGAVRVVIDGGIVSVAEIADGIDKVVIEGGEIGEIIVSENVPVEINDTTLGGLKIDSPAEVTVGDSVVGKVEISDSADVKLSGKTVAEEINVAGEGSKLAVGDETKVGELNVGAPAEISVSGKTKVDNVNIAADGEGSVIDTARGSTIGKIDSAADVTVTGNGKVSGVSGDGNVTNASGSAVTPGGSTGGGFFPVHTHDFKETERTDATCTAEGSITLKCSCGEMKTEVIPAKGHTEVVDSEAVEATCTKAGVTKVSHCGVCGAIISEAKEIPALGHAEVEIPAVDPTCVGTGLTAGKKCSRCGITTVEQETVPAKGHVPTEVPAVEPTCTEDGHTAGSECEVCGELLGATERVSALGHDEVEIPAVAATCTEDGLTAGVKCARCGAVVVEQTVVKAAGHIWGSGEVIPNPIGGSDTIFTFTCKVCGYVKQNNTGDVQVAPAALYELSVDDGNLVASITPVDNSNVFSYEIYLSKDDVTWISAGSAWAQVSEGNLPSCKVIGSLLVPGTYTRMKIVSFPNNGYGRNYALFDCSITVEEDGESGMVPLYYKTNSGKLLNFVGEIPEGYTGISHIMKDSERKDYIRGMYFDKNTAYREFDLPYSMETSDDLTSCFVALDLVGGASVSDAHTGSVKLKLGEVLPFTFSSETDHIFGAWKVTTPATPEADGERQHTCVICGYTETEIIDNGVPRVSAATGFSFKKYNSGSLRFAVDVEDKSNILRYDIFLSTDGGNSWGTRFGYAMTDDPLDQTSLTVSVDSVESLAPGSYNKVKIISAPNDAKNYKTNSVILDCDISISDGGEFDGMLKFRDTDSSKYTVDYIGLDDYCIMKGDVLWDDQNMTTKKRDTMYGMAKKSFTLNKAHVGNIIGYYYKVYQLIGTFTDEKLEAVIYSSPLRACELAAEPTTLDVPNGCTFSLDNNGNICATLDMDGKSTEGALSYDILLKPDNADDYTTFGAVSADKVGEPAVMNQAVLNGMSFKKLRVRANPGANIDYLVNTVDLDCDLTGVFDVTASPTATFTKVDEGIRVDFAGLDADGTMPTLLLYKDVADEQGGSTKQQVDYALASESSRESIIISGIDSLSGMSYYIEQYINTVEEGTPQKVAAKKISGVGSCLKQVEAVTGLVFVKNVIGFPIVRLSRPENADGITIYRVYFEKNGQWYSMCNVDTSGISSPIGFEHMAGEYTRFKVVSDVKAGSGYEANTFIGDCSLTIIEPSEPLEQVLCTFYDDRLTIDSGTEPNTSYVVNLLRDGDIFGAYYLMTDSEGNASQNAVFGANQKKYSTAYIVSKVTTKVDGTNCTITAEKCGVSQTLTFVTESSGN